MSHPITICADLSLRLDRYRARYHEVAKTLPVTLDEWIWLAECSADFDKVARGYVPQEFSGVPLVLVAEVYDRPDGSLVVKK